MVPRLHEVNCGWNRAHPHTDRFRGPPGARQNSRPTGRHECHSALRNRPAAAAIPQRRATRHSRRHLRPCCPSPGNSHSRNHRASYPASPPAPTCFSFCQARPAAPIRFQTGRNNQTSLRKRHPPQTGPPFCLRSCGNNSVRATGTAVSTPRFPA